MLVWQGNESRIWKVKLHSCTAYRVSSLVLKVNMDIRFLMLLKRVGPMEEAHPSLEL
jgi:hypothetical protein